MLPYQILSFTIHHKIWKSRIKTINLKYLLQHGMTNFNYLMGHIPYLILKIILSISLKNKKQ